MKHSRRILFLLALVLAMASSLAAQTESVTIRADSCYLLLPIRESADPGCLVISCGGFEDLVNRSVRLSREGEDYWVFYDISRYHGKVLNLRFNGPSGALSRLRQSSVAPFRVTAAYNETGRPKQHFTFLRGWNNDPNGMIYHEGKYHLFAQHNPFEANWENMHWGHAVSEDMVHWREEEIALYPDSLGMMFSGTAVMDWNNTSGLGRDGVPPMVALYTAHSDQGEVQCLAYSLDGGAHWTKYPGNPVLRHSDRDPKVFWYPEGGHWVMVLYDGDGHSFFTSSDLISWKYESHVKGFYECPDFYPLSVDADPANQKWVLSGASGQYLVGDFDGRTFTPLTPFRQTLHGISYAGQVFSGMPSSRVVQIAWLRASFRGMPFKGSFSTPLEMSLRTTPDGIRLFASPVKEFECLQHSIIRERGLTLEQADGILSGLRGEEHLRIRLRIKAPNGNGGLSLFRGGQILAAYDAEKATVNGFQVSGSSVYLDLILDHGLGEVYINDGLIGQFLSLDETPGLEYGLSGNLGVELMEVYSLDSIW